MRRIEVRLVWRLDSSQPLSPSITVRRFVRADWDTKMCPWSVTGGTPLCILCASFVSGFLNALQNEHKKNTIC